MKTRARLGQPLRNMNIPNYLSHRAKCVIYKSILFRLFNLLAFVALITNFTSLDAVSPELEVSGNKIVVKSTQEPIRLTGVNIPSMLWGPGTHLLTSLDVAVHDWKVNIVRLPVDRVKWHGQIAGEAYRNTVDEFIDHASDLGIYIILDLHGFEKILHADENFWTDAAERYKNNPTVLFGLFNEPHSIDWDTWRDGDVDGPGMQGLLDAVRATGANNIVLAAGTEWSFNLSKILEGYALEDTQSGNGIVYDSHVYPWGTYRYHQIYIGNVARVHPVFIGELGHPGVTEVSFLQDEFEGDPTWVPRFLDWVDTQNLHWTGWCFYPGADPVMIKTDDWSFTPSSFWGAPAKKRLQAYRNPYALRILGGEVIGTLGTRQDPDSGVLTDYIHGAVTAFDERYVSPAFDQWYPTYFDASTANGGWAGLDLEKPQRITRIRYMPRRNYGHLMMNGIFEASNSPTFDGGSTTILHTIIEEPVDSGGVYTTQLISNPEEFRYIRYRGPDGSYCNVTSVLFYTGYIENVTINEDIIVVDDASPDVTYSGTWTLSTWTGYFGKSARYDDPNEKSVSWARFTPKLTSAGLYEVSARWNANLNRSSSTPIDIIHEGGVTTTVVDQTINGGQWNSLGTYVFDAGTSGSVLVRTDGTTGYVIADAIMLRKVEDVEDEVEIIMDNADGLINGVDYIGNWSTVSSVPGYFATDYVRDDNTGKGDKSVCFTPDITDEGNYKVYILWTGRPTNASAVPVTVTHANGMDMLLVDQTTPGGEWFCIGEYRLTTAGGGKVEISNEGTDGFVIVDAVRFLKSGGPRAHIVTVDSEDVSSVSLNGNWLPSSAIPGFIGDNYLHDNNYDKGGKSVTFTPDIPESGTYSVYMTWPPHSNRSTGAIVTINHGSGQTTKVVNQRSYGGYHNYLGSFHFNVVGGNGVTITNAGPSGYVIADSVRFEAE